MCYKGQFDVSICVEFLKEIPSIDSSACILGMDYSQSYFFVDSEGKKAYALANRYNMIIIEDLDLRALAQSKRYGKNLHDNGFGNFWLYIKYKLEQQGKYFVKAPKTFASTQLCSNCGYKHTELKGNVTIREWDCPCCNVHHNRDINAALNLKNYGEDYWKNNILPNIFVA